MSIETTPCGRDHIRKWDTCVRRGPLKAASGKNETSLACQPRHRQRPCALQQPLQSCSERRQIRRSPERAPTAEVVAPEGGGQVIVECMRNEQKIKYEKCRC